MRVVLGMALVPLLVLAACSEGPLVPIGQGTVEARLAAEGIVLENHDVHGRYHIVIERELSSRVDLNLNPRSEQHWIRVPAGESRVVPLTLVHGYQPDAREVVIYSWIRSVAMPGPSGIQWVGEGFVWRVVELQDPIPPGRGSAL